MTLLGVPMAAWRINSNLEALGVFVATINAAIPDLHRRSKEALTAAAQERDWPWEEFDCATQDLDGTYMFTLPGVLNKSVIAMLHAATEAGLIDLCRHHHRAKNMLFDVGELSGSPIDRARLYLSRCADIDLTRDPAWPLVRDVQFLRNLIVHGNGIVTPLRASEKRISCLLSRYPDMVIADIHLLGPEKEIRVTSEFCTLAIDLNYGLFRRLFRGLGIAAPNSPRWSDVPD